VQCFFHLSLTEQFKIVANRCFAVELECSLRGSLDLLVQAGAWWWQVAGAIIWSFYDISSTDRQSKKTTKNAVEKLGTFNS